MEMLIFHYNMKHILRHKMCILQLKSTEIPLSQILPAKNEKRHWRIHYFTWHMPRNNIRQLLTFGTVTITWEPYLRTDPCYHWLHHTTTFPNTSKYTSIFDCGPTRQNDKNCFILQTLNCPTKSRTNSTDHLLTLRTRTCNKFGQNLCSLRKQLKIGLRNYYK